MKPNHKISRAVAAILGASAVHSAVAADSTSSADTSTLQEIIVTATRRTENIQNVPMTVQALTGGMLEQLNVQVLSDYLKYLPNVTSMSFGPGQTTLIMRGLSVGQLGIQESGGATFFPNVATYLDEQPTLLPGRGLDVYAVDLARIEVLEGPQGTLFGAGAQAGVMRYITNRPELNNTSVAVNAGYGTTAHGDASSNVNAVLNLPLIPDTLAARLVVYNDSRGGYINNLPATFARLPTDLGLALANGGIVPTNSVTINNFLSAANNINPLTYQGLRASLLWKFADDWDALLQQTYQNMNASGVFYEQPYSSEGGRLNDLEVPINGTPLPPLSVNLFQPSFDKDRFENTALTVEGKVGSMSLVYAGSYLVRNVEQAQDYTNYSRGRFAYYYQCLGVTYSATSGNPDAQCYSPGASWHDTENVKHLSQELRVSTPIEWRLRGLAGIFYEDLKIADSTDWLYKSVPECAPGGPTSDCFLPIAPPAGVSVSDPSVRNANTSFFQDFKRTFSQKAAFASVSFDILPKTLTITGGLRYFDMHTSLAGAESGSFFCKQFAPTTYFGPCTTANAQTVDQSLVSTGHLGRADLVWHITPDILTYYTYSQGYRPGGINMVQEGLLPDQQGIARYNVPSTYGSDLVTNNEIGWKTELFDHRVRFNGAVYQENWDNVQTFVFCPQCGLGIIPFTLNGPFYRVRGVEIQLAAHPMRGLTVQGAAAWNSSNLTNSPQLIANNPASSEFGQPITTQYINGVALPIPNVFGEVNSPLANSPPQQSNMLVRYEWPVGGYLPYVQAGFQHQAHSLSSTGFVRQFDQPAWTTYDASIGVSKDDWTVSVIGSNLTNVNKSLYTTDIQFILQETPMRPRTITLTFSYHFASH